jgi:crotonobetainyl-CoA:carnitine CoA-transferase CaiB-like acyl-CoA transferase
VQALDNVRVLDFTQMMLGPFATQLLGDLGADVIKVERPGGEWERGLSFMGGYVDGESAAFLAMNRNKRSIELDFKAEWAREALLKLAASCDVVVENFRPGVMARLGLGYDDFKAVKPDIIYCSGSGWGQDSDLAKLNRPGQDLLIQAMSGLAAATGRGGTPPTPAGTSIVDHATALTLACAILAALYARNVHGVGQRVEVDLYSTAIAMQCQEISALVNQGTDWTRSPSGVGAAWLSAPFGLYETADGWLALSMAEPEEVAAAFAAPALADMDPWIDREEMKLAIDAIVKTQPTAHWLDLLLGAGLWAAEVRTTKDAVDELAATGSDLLRRMERAGGSDITVVGLPIGLSETPWQLRMPPPLAGQHTIEVLSEVMSPEQLRMRLGSGS